MTGSVETPESRQLTLGDQVLQRPKLRHSWRPGQGARPQWSWRRWSQCAL